MLLELLYHPQFFVCVRTFWNAILAKLVFLSRYQNVLNMAEALYIL